MRGSKGDGAGGTALARDAGAGAGAGSADAVVVGRGVGALGAGGCILPHASATAAIIDVFSEFFADQGEGGQDKGRILL